MQRQGPGWGCRGGAWALHRRREVPRAEDQVQESNRLPGAYVDRESTGRIPFRSFVPLPHCLPQGLRRPRWTPNRGWVPLGVGTPPLPQPPPRGAGPRGPAFIFAPPSLPPTPSGPASWRGPRWAEDQARDLSRLPGAQVGRGNLAMLPFDPLLSQSFLN